MDSLCGGLVTCTKFAEPNVTLLCSVGTSRTDPQLLTTLKTSSTYSKCPASTLKPRIDLASGHLLPNITSLEIIIDGPQCHDIADITYLISQWSHKLVSLKIKCQSKSAQVPEETENRQMQIKQLLLSLNTITSLRRLSIKCKWWECSQMQEAIDLTILSQLEYIYFKTGQYDFENLRHSLVRYAGPNSHLKQIELPSLWLLPENDLLSEPQLLSKLTMLKLGLDDQLSRHQWALLPSLTTVDLGYIQSRSEFMEAITGMQCLKLIRTLKMLVYHDFVLDHVPIDLPQLPSVTKLKLLIMANLFTNPYTTLQSLQLGTIFPSVEFVYLAYCSSSSYRVVKWMTKIIYRMFKLRLALG